MINIGVNLGLLPTKGLTLPFVSYGGSSMLACAGSLGILLRISLENSAVYKGPSSDVAVDASPTLKPLESLLDRQAHQTARVSSGLDDVDQWFGDTNSNGGQLND
jgi:hypothetical protein